MSSFETSNASADEQTFQIGGDGQGTLLVSTTALYDKVWDDYGSGAKKDVAIWRPKPSQDYFIIGDYAVGNYSPYATGSALTVKAKNDDSAKQPMLAKPQGWNLVWSRAWTSKSTKAKIQGSIWAPVPPAGYLTLGHIATNGSTSPDVPEFRCVRRDLVEITQAGNEIWNDHGSGASGDVELYAIIGVENAFLSQANYHAPTFTPYRLKSF